MEKPSNDSHGILLVGLCMPSYVAVLALLARRRRQLSTTQKCCDSVKESTSRPESTISPWLIRAAGMLVSLITIAIPYVAQPVSALARCSVRITCFFYACKLLDLSVARARTPPVLMKSMLIKRDDAREPRPLLTTRDLIVYVWLLLTEMRYHSFDIAVLAKGRPDPREMDPFDKDSLIPAVVIPVAAYWVSNAPIRFLLLLLIIQFSFEILHCLVHPGCPHPLFYRPFNASGFVDFWMTRWHSGAASFLRSLAYEPAKRIGGRAFGVLAAFSLSGIWHGWATAAVVEDEHSLRIAFQVWLLFLAMGLFCLVEKAIWGDRDQNQRRRYGYPPVVWFLASFIAGQCLISLRETSKIEVLRRF